MSATREYLGTKLERSTPHASFAWLEASAREIAQGVDEARFAGLLSLASRHVPRGALVWNAREISDAFDIAEGWNPERWSVLDTARVWLVLSRSDLGQESGARALESAFQYADMGELVALYRSLAHLPDARRFLWRAGEGCRTSMRAVFESIACDTPYPALHFDDRAWRQLVIKCLFVEAPLWRVYGLDRRIDAELARMALDLADERRSAGREVRHELWLCLGRAGGARGLAALARELEGSHTLGRRAAALALARAGAIDALRERAESESNPQVRASMRAALTGRVPSEAFRALDPSEQVQVT